MKKACETVIKPRKKNGEVTNMHRKIIEEHSLNSIFMSDF
jgi:hypothetical protein